MRTSMPWTRVTRPEMDRLLNRFLEGKLEAESSLEAEWVPCMDVSETKDSLIAKLEVPGMDPRDIQISLQENLLTIKGEKWQDQKEQDEHYHRVERTYGMFARSVRLPVTVDGSKVVATFKNGLLAITLPKTPTSKGTTIPIKAE
jgi:HSP20 family protein